MDIAKQLGIHLEVAQRDTQNKYTEERVDNSKGFFDAIKDWGKELLTSSDGKIILKKHVFLSRDLEIRSLNTFHHKCELLLEQVYSEVASGEIPMNPEEMATIAGLYYIIK